MSAPTSTASSPSLSTWLSQHRRLVVAVAAAITVSTAGALYYSHSAQQARQAEQKQQKQAKKDAKKGKKTPPPTTTTAAEKPKSSSSESSSNDGEFELPLYRHRSKLTPTRTRRRFEAVGDRHRSHGRSGEYARADLPEKPTDTGKGTDPIADGAGLEGARQQALRLEAVRRRHRVLHQGDRVRGAGRLLLEPRSLSVFPGFR